jgi:hypothetical protein
MTKERERERGISVIHCPLCSLKIKSETTKQRKSKEEYCLHHTIPIELLVCGLGLGVQSVRL